ncbi:MAG: TMEM175 family protein [Gammaproteobacteria bacterium]
MSGLLPIMSLEVREQRQLRRLETLVDVVFGITIWRLFVLLPRPDENPEWTTLLAMLADSLLNFVVVVIALIIVIIYWIQSNLLFKYLVRTDSWHIGLSIAQLFSLLLFLYAIRVGIQLEANASTRVFESAMACLLGMFSFFAWYYALHRGSLVTDELGVEEAKSITERIKAEPVTAAITIPFAAGMWMWELSWFIYPFVVYLLKRRNKRSASGVSD